MLLKTVWTGARCAPWALPLLLVGLLVTRPAVAATISATSCSTSAVQTAINSAVDGDTVLVPAGTCSWTSGITIRGKGIKLQGGGSGRIIARSTTSVSVGSGSKTFVTQSGLNISPGQTLRISQLGSRRNFVEGTVTSYSGTTLIINATNAGGSGTPKLWIISTQPTTVITHNTPGILIDVDEDTSHHVEISDIKIANGSGSGRRVSVSRNGQTGKAVLLHDCWLETANGAALYWTDSNRGVIWNCSFDSSPFSMDVLAIHQQAIGVTTSWTTPSTMGSADPTGQSNLYVEDSDFHAFLHATDLDHNARTVFRHVLFNHAAIGTHGPDTSVWGQRHFEVYDSEFVFSGYSDGTTLPLNHWFFVRGGTFVATDNIIPVIDSQDYPNKPEVEITVMNLQRNAGPNPCWGAGIPGIQYPSPRQAGLGRVTGNGRDGLGRSTDSTTYVGDSEPIYIWNNTSNGALNVGFSDFGECSGADRTSDYVRPGRDYFLNAGAKPGYQKFVYPHPLRTQAPTGSAPHAPSGLRIIPE